MAGLLTTPAWAVPQEERANVWPPGVTPHRYPSPPRTVMVGRNVLDMLPLLMIAGVVVPNLWEVGLAVTEGLL
jgi:hypothetical protein